MAINHVEMPKIDTTAYEEGLQRVYRKLAEAFGIDYAALSRDFEKASRFNSGGRITPSTPIPVTRPRGEHIIPNRLYGRWMRNVIFEGRLKLPMSVTLTWIVGYNPQRLLEDHRG